MSSRDLRFALLALTVVAPLALTSCSARSIRKASIDKSSASSKTGPEFTPDVNVTEASLRGSEFSNVEGLDSIYFEYDSSALKTAALDILKKNAEYLKVHKDTEVLVAGYCDERGTIEYNLALGQKRAKEVRDYYIRLGVPGQSVATISYGKENPACTEANESCWARSRRAETRIRARTAANNHLPDQSTQ